MTATIPVPVTPEEQAKLLAQANAQGVSVDLLLRRAVLNLINPAGQCEQPPLKYLNGDELERAFEEIADMIPENVPPIPNEALRRKNLYSREDEW